MRLPPSGCQYIVLIRAHLQSFQELIHKSVEKYLTTKFCFTNSVSESPVSEGDEKWPECGIIQLHNQFQEYLCRTCFKVLDNLIIRVINGQLTFGFNEASFRISKSLKNNSNNSFEEPVRSSRDPSVIIHSIVTMNIPSV